MAYYAHYSCQTFHFNGPSMKNHDWSHPKFKFIFFFLKKIREFHVKRLTAISYLSVIQIIIRMNWKVVCRRYYWVSSAQLVGFIFWGTFTVMLCNANELIIIVCVLLIFGCTQYVGISINPKRIIVFCFSSLIKNDNNVYLCM